MTAEAQLAEFRRFFNATREELAAASSSKTSSRLCTDDNILHFLQPDGKILTYNSRFEKAERSLMAQLDSNAMKSGGNVYVYIGHTPDDDIAQEFIEWMEGFEATVKFHFIFGSLANMSSQAHLNNNARFNSYLSAILRLIQHSYDQPSAVEVAVIDVHSYNKLLSAKGWPADKVEELNQGPKIHSLCFEALKKTAAIPTVIKDKDWSQLPKEFLDNYAKL